MLMVVREVEGLQVLITVVPAADTAVLVDQESL
jgi:hypothetical protein